MALAWKDRIKVASATSGTGTLTLGAAASGYQTFAAGDDAKVFAYVIEDGTAWETGYGTYTHSGTTFARTTFSASSTGSAISCTGAENLFVDLIAETADSAVLGASAQPPGGRLTLVSGVPVYAPKQFIAVSGQDTGNDLITLTAHGWVVGTAFLSSATSGGLTAFTQYYAGNITTNTISVHLTLAAALAGTSKVDITGTVTASIFAVAGCGGSAIYYTPYISDKITLWDGTNWKTVTFAETTYTLTGLTGSRAYDLFGYLSAGVLTLEVLLWTDDTTRATAVTIQDGRYCKSGDKTRLLLGTFYTNATATITEDSLFNGYLCNVYNQAPRRGFAFMASGGSHTYTTATLREWANMVRYNWIDALGGMTVQAGGFWQFQGTVAVLGYGEMGFNQTTFTGSVGALMLGNPLSNFRTSGTGIGVSVAGKNFATMLEYGSTGCTYEAAYCQPLVEL